VVGGFVIEAVAGRGGMGVVYRAQQKKPSRVVAIKVIAPELAGDPAFRARFERESTIAAQIEHPNVIPVHAVGEDQGILFIAMRFIAGVDLRTLILQEGRLEPNRAAAIIDQVAQALDAAHGHGLVHRDVKPANILLSRSGGRDHVYLTDFGLTRHVEGSQGVTGTGAFLGTVDYVAPEQARAERVDARSDVYSLGCVLFHALSGTVPFPLENDLAKLYAHDAQPPPSVCERAPDVPTSFEPVCMRAMAKMPDDRYPSAGDLGRAGLAAAGSASPSRVETSVAVGEAAPLGVATVRRRARSPDASRATTDVSPAGPRPAGRPTARWPHAAAGRVAVILGLAGAILGGGGGGGGGKGVKGSRPAPGRTTAGPTATTGVFAGASSGAILAYVSQYPSLAVQREPKTAAAVTARLAYKDTVTIKCAAIGDPVSVPSGKDNTLTSPLWDEIATSSAKGFVPDVWLQPGTPVAPAFCSTPQPQGRSAYRAQLVRRPNLGIHSGPLESTPLTHQLPYRTAVIITCIAIGQQEQAPFGKSHLTTPVWDKVSDTSGRELGFVPDVWVSTGTKPVAPLCPALTPSASRAAAAH
jgi:predicted Ser/Thr protein kinase